MFDNNNIKIIKKINSKKRDNLNQNDGIKGEPTGEFFH